MNLLNMKKTDGGINDLMAIATSLGEIKATQTLMLDQLKSSATKDQLHNVKEDVDGLGKLIRENHSNLDGRVRVLEQGQPVLISKQEAHTSLIAKILDATFKVLVALALGYIGFKGLT